MLMDLLDIWIVFRGDSQNGCKEKGLIACNRPNVFRFKNMFRDKRTKGMVVLGVAGLVRLYSKLYRQLYSLL